MLDFVTRYFPISSAVVIAVGSSLVVLIIYGYMIGDEKKILFPRLQQYLRDGLVLDTRNIKVTLGLRSFTRWYFDFEIYILTLGALWALARKSHSYFMYCLLAFSAGLLVLYIYSYFDNWHLNVLHGFGKSKIASDAGAIVWLIFLFALSAVTLYLLFTSVDAIIQSN